MTAFAGSMLPSGEIVFNPDVIGGAGLGISLTACLSTAAVRARPDAASSLAAFSFHEALPGRTKDIGVKQRRPVL